MKVLCQSAYMFFFGGLVFLATSCSSTHETFNPKILPEDVKLVTVVQTGHSAPITSVAFSPDGRYVLSGSMDHTVKLWDAFLGREIRSFKGHTDVVSAVAFIPKSRLIISASWDHSLKIWDATTGDEIRTLRGHSDRVLAVAVTPDGRHAISGSGDYSMIMWNISTGNKSRVFGGHTYSVKWNPNPGLTHTGYEDRDHRSLGLYYHYRTPKKAPRHAQRFSTFGHIDAVSSLAIDAIGKYVISGSLDHTLRLSNLRTGTRNTIYSLRDAYFLSVSLTPDGKYAVCGCSDNTVRLISISRKSVVRTFSGYQGPVNAVMVSPDGQAFISASRDGTIKSHDINYTGISRPLSGKHQSGVNACAYSPDGRYAVTGDKNGKLILWETQTGFQVNSLKGSASAVNAMALLPNGKYLLSANKDGTLKLWNTATGQQEKVYRGHQGAVTAVDMFANKDLAASASKDGCVIIWDINDGKKRSKYKVASAPITSLSVSPDDHRLLVGTETGELSLFETATGKVLWHADESESIFSVGFSPDNRFVVCTSAAKRFTLRDAFSGKVVRRFQGHFYGVNTAVFSPDGHTIFSAGGDQAVKAWDVATGKLKMTYKDHLAKVTSLAVSQNERMLISGGEDQSLILWEINNRWPVKRFYGHLDLINGICLAPDMQYAYSGSGDGTIRKWHIASGSELGRMHGSHDGEWITTTPDGYYAKSLESNNLVHYVIPGIFETYTYDQFETMFNKPDVVKKRFGGCLDCFKPAPELSQPPLLDLEKHQMVDSTPAQTYPIKLKASSINQVKNVRIFVNGKPTINFPANTEEIKITLTVPLFPGANRITAIAFDDNGFFSNPKYVDVKCETTELDKPNLYVIGLGISYYPKLSGLWQLNYAHTDSEAIVARMQKEQGKLFNTIHHSLITNDAATVEKITEVLEAHQDVNENDIVVIHMAGHGIKDKKGTFYFLTSSVSDIEKPQKGGISWMLLQTYLSKIKGRVIILLDACHSGSITTEKVVPNDQLAQEFFSGKRGGMMVFSASKGRQYSLESPDIGNGAGIFTYALIMGLSEKSSEVDDNANGVVEFMELVDFVSQYVDRETKGEQTPWLARKELFGDFPIAMVQ